MLNGAAGPCYLRLYWRCNHLLVPCCFGSFHCHLLAWQPPFCFIGTMLLWELSSRCSISDTMGARRNEGPKERRTTERRIEGTNGRRNDGTAERRNDGKKEQRNKGTKEQRNKGTAERRNDGRTERRSGGAEERRNARTQERGHEGRRSGGTKERRNGGTKERRNEGTKERTKLAILWETCERNERTKRTKERTKMLLVSRRRCVARNAREPVPHTNSAKNAQFCPI